MLGARQNVTAAPREESRHALMECGLALWRHRAEQHTQKATLTESIRLPARDQHARGDQLLERQEQTILVELRGQRSVRGRCEAVSVCDRERVRDIARVRLERI